MSKYVLVSQGIKIFESNNKQEVETIMKNENEKYYDYYQLCIDKNETPADNEIFMYEEKDKWQELKEFLVEGIDYLDAHNKSGTYKRQINGYKSVLTKMKMLEKQEEIYNLRNNKNNINQGGTV